MISWYTPFIPQESYLPYTSFTSMYFINLIRTTLQRNTKRIFKLTHTFTTLICTENEKIRAFTTIVQPYTNHPLTFAQPLFCNLHLKVSFAWWGVGTVCIELQQNLPKKNEKAILKKVLRIFLPDKSLHALELVHTLLEKYIE